MARIVNFAIIFITLFIAVSSAFSAEYDPEAPLRVKRVELSLDKPRGLGNFKPLQGNEFKKNKEVYIYIELGNCKPEKVNQYYHTRFVMDIDIYYQDGICIYSEEEANVFNYQSTRRKSDAYVWTKIETSYLKEGEYKVEMVIKDENSGKEAFGLTRFKIVDGSKKTTQNYSGE